MAYYGYSDGLFLGKMKGEMHSKDLRFGQLLNLVIKYLISISSEEIVGSSLFYHFVERRTFKVLSAVFMLFEKYENISRSPAVN